MSLREQWAVFKRAVQMTAADFSASHSGVRFYDDGTAEVAGRGRSPVREVVVNDGRRSKTGVGRFAAGVVTLGVSALSPSERGTLSVTVVTHDWAVTRRYDAATASRGERLIEAAMVAKSRVTLVLPPHDGGDAPAR